MTVSRRSYSGSPCLIFTVESTARNSVRYSISRMFRTYSCCTKLAPQDTARCLGRERFAAIVGERPLGHAPALKRLEQQTLERHLVLESTVWVRHWDVHVAISMISPHCRPVHQPVAVLDGSWGCGLCSGVHSVPAEEGETASRNTLLQSLEHGCLAEAGSANDSSNPS